MAKLALRGGEPLRTKPWPAWPQHDEREVRYLQRVVESGNWGGFPSPNVMAGEFAEKFAAYHGAKYGICTTGGTTALEVSLRAAGLERGDEVLVPAITFYATPFAALVQGYKPVFVDIDPDSWCIDVEQIERHITPDTRAILPVHLGSRMADMDRIGEIARKHEPARHRGLRAHARRLLARARRRHARRHGLLQLPVVEADDVRRGRHHHHERRAVRGALPRIRELGPREDDRPRRRPRARCSAGTIGSPSSRRRCCWRSSSGCRSRSRGATRTSRTSSGGSPRSRA